MKTGNILTICLLTLGLGLAACKKESGVDKAVDSTKDALNMREHEELKDAAEDAGDAAKGAAEGVKEEAKDAADGK